MKNTIAFGLLTIVILVVWFILIKHDPKSPTNMAAGKSGGVQPTADDSKADFVNEAVFEASPAAITATQTNNESHAGLNPFQAQNIEEWKTAIPNLRNDRTDLSNWVMSQRYKNSGVRLVVGDVNKDAVDFYANMINIYTRRDNSGIIRRVQMHSTWMTIAEARSLGKSLLRIMNKDTTGFSTWCDKVGNRWMDQPQFSSEDVHLPNSGKFFGFEARHTFNDEKPWYVLLIITDP